MTRQHVKFITSIVTTQLHPTLAPDPDDPSITVPTLDIQADDLTATEHAVANKEFDIDVPPSQVRRHIAMLANGCLDGLSLPTRYFQPQPSRPLDNVWEPTSDLYLHPMSANNQVCVGDNSGTWLQLALRVELSAATLP